MWVISGLILSSNFQLHFRWKFLVQVLWKSDFWMNVKFIFFVINDPCRIFNPEERLYCTSSFLEKCLEFTKLKRSDINKRELRYTIKGTYWIMSKSSKGFLLTYLIAFVELYIKMHKCNSLINNRRIVIVNVVKIILKLQAWPTWRIFGFMNSRHFSKTKDVQYNRLSELKVLLKLKNLISGKYGKIWLHNTFWFPSRQYMQG